MQPRNDDCRIRQVYPEESANRDTVFHQATLVAGSHVYGIDSLQGSPTELVLGAFAWRRGQKTVGD